jgi:hypothetical protein
MKTIQIKSNKRDCGDCTLCCQGYLNGEAHGHAFFRGTPCFFLEKKCTIYSSRPKDPCVNYNCSWLIDENIPSWMKPNLIGAIIDKRNVDGINYYCIIEAGKKLDASVLNYMILYCINNNLNLLYTIEGGNYRIGSKEFLNLIDKSSLMK